MHPILLYLLKMLLCSGILYGYYRVALYNERFHQWNRFYLLFAMLCSVLVPLVEIPLFTNAQPTPVVYVMELLPWNNSNQTGLEVVATTSSISPMVLSVLAICIVSFVLLFKFVMGIIKMFHKHMQGNKSKFDDVKVIFTDEPTAPYSFFNWLFWRTDLDLNGPSGKRMLQHELTHIRQKHSLDKLFMELTLIFCWMNPFFWLIRKELYILHEFLADQNAIEQNNGPAFAEMILQSIHIHPTPVLSNPFFTSQIKRRLFMITTSHTNRFSFIKRIFTLCFGVGTMFLIACTSQKTEDPAKPIDSSAVRDFKTLELPEGTLIFFDGKPISNKEMKNLNPDLIDYDVLLSKEAALEKYGTNAPNGAYELYSIQTISKSVQSSKQDLPSFPGGPAEWTKYLQKSLQYPDIAVDNGTMGVTKIAFTVLKDGSIKDLVIIENPGDGLGEEAKRIIATGPNWKPGMVNGIPIEKRVIMPITFRLE